MNLLFLIGFGVVVAIAIGAASVIPAQSIVGCNAQVTVQAQEVPLVVATYFSITSVSGSVTGPATLLDWTSWASTSPFTVQSTFTMTVSVGGHTSSKTASQWFPSIPVVNGGSISATNTFNVPQVPMGQQGISVTLTQGGSTVATGSGSMQVSC